MKKIKPTVKNPHGLTHKQSLAVELMLENVAQGKSLQPTQVHKTVYDVGSNNSAAVQFNQNMKKDNFRAALLEGLKNRNLIGANSKVEEKLVEGLDATEEKLHAIIDPTTGKKSIIKSTEIDYQTRLAYVREINKISGVYAPTTNQTKKITLNVDLTPEEIQANLAQLQAELNT